MSEVSNQASLGDNADHGLNAETAACERWPLERISGDNGEPDWYDCRFTEDLESDLAGTIVEAGTPVEVKACQIRIDDGNRAGRWWIRRESHERLLEAGGEYVLSVHDRGEIVRQCLLWARTIDEHIDGWWAAGDGGKTADEFRQLPWTAVIAEGGGR